MEVRNPTNIFKRVVMNITRNRFTSSVFYELLSIKFSLINLIGFIVVSIITTGFFGNFFLVFGGKLSENSGRKISFDINYKEIDDFMTKPKIISSSIGAAFKSGLVVFENLDEESMEFLWKTARINIDRLGGSYFMWWVSDPELFFYRVYYYNSNNNAVPLSFLAKSDNGEDFEMCYVNSSTGKKISGYIPVINYRNSSSAAMAKGLQEKKYLPSYMHSCPSYMCTLVLSYVYPVFDENSTYVGATGVTIDVMRISKFLEETTNKDDVSFIYERNTGKLIGSSISSIMVFDKENSIRYLASNNENIVVKTIYNRVENMDLKNGEKKKFYLFFDTLLLVDVGILEKEGLDWVFVVYTSWITYYTNQFIFSLVFLIITVITLFLSLSCATAVVEVIRNNLEEIKSEMKRTEFLNFEISETNCFFNEIVEIEKSFHFLVEKIKEFSAFLPEGIKQNLTVEHKKKKVFSSRFGEKRVYFKDITLVLIKFHNYENLVISPSRYRSEKYVSQHTEVLSIVQDLSKRGTIIKFTEDRIYVGFNVNISLDNHNEFGVKFAVELKEKIEKKISEIFSIVVETGRAKISVLGTEAIKIQYLNGEVRKKVKVLSKLCKNGNKHKHKILIGERCIFKQYSDKQECIDKLSKKFKICTIDAFLNDENELEKLYFAERQITARDSEWMYVLEMEEKIKRMKENDSLIWKHVSNNKYKEVLELLENEKMENYKFWKPVINELKEKKITFIDYCKFRKKSKNQTLFTFKILKE